MTGFTVYKANGDVQFDSEVPTLVFSHKTTYGGIEYDLGYGFSDIIPVVRCSKPVRIKPASRSWVLQSTESQNITVYFFRSAPTASGSSGLQVFDENGNITYNSTQKSMRVLGFVDVSPYFPDEEETPQEVFRGTGLLGFIPTPLSRPRFLANLGNGYSAQFLWDHLSFSTPSNSSVVVHRTMIRYEVGQIVGGVRKYMGPFSEKLPIVDLTGL